jgi:hypothetical protein
MSSGLELRLAWRCNFRTGKAGLAAPPAAPLADPLGESPACSNPKLLRPIKSRMFRATFAVARTAQSLSATGSAWQASSFAALTKRWDRTGT